MLFSITATLFYLEFNNSITIANYCIAIILLIIILCIVSYFILLINYAHLKSNKAKIIDYPKIF